jgi:cytidyltransferase-like protein
MRRKILVMGLPGAGKTTLSRALAPLLNAVHFESDAVRANVNRDLGFSLADRIEQARRMGWLCDRVVEAGGYAIADFVCPTRETREAFGEATVIWVDRIEQGRFEDTNRLFEKPKKSDYRVTTEGAPEFWAHKIYTDLRPVFDLKKPTALFVGRYQPFHDGHKALIEEGLRRVGQVCIAIRDTQGIDEKNPFDFLAIKTRIETALHVWSGRFTIIQIPNVTNIFYGRDVGYTIEQIIFPDNLQAISATNLRNLINESAQVLDEVGRYAPVERTATSGMR